MDWEHEHRVGIRELDEQHQGLVECIFSIEQAVARREGTSAIQGALAQLVSMTELHFTVEETLMRIHGYPRLDEHTDHHRAFSAELKALHARSLTTELSHRTIHFLREWWFAHISKQDKAYAFHFLMRTALGRAR